MLEHAARSSARLSSQRAPPQSVPKPGRWIRDRASASTSSVARRMRGRKSRTRSPRAASTGRPYTTGSSFTSAASTRPRHPATCGSTQISCAPALLWGVVLHEYGHQVDFLLLEPAQRDRFHSLLGGEEWFPVTPSLPHDAYGCERFASTFAWSYWPSPANSMKPNGPGDESSAMRPRQFRLVLDEVLSP